MAERKLRIGIVGATPGVGWGPRAHIPAYRALPEVELTAVCTAHPETARAAAEEFGIAEHYADYRELVRSPSVDAVAVVTRIVLHHPITAAALEAGKHVYTEWPLGVDARQAAESLELARSKGLRHIVGLQSRFAPPLLRLKELLREGYIGRPLTFHMSMFLPGALQPRPSAYAFIAKKEAGAGALSISGGHAIDALCWLLGDIQALSAQVSTQVREWTLPDTGQRVEVTTPDNVGFVAHFRNGAVGTVQLSNTATAGPGFRLEVYGTDGKLGAASSGMVELSLLRLYGAKRGEREQEIPIPDHLIEVPELPLESPAYNIAQLFRGFVRAVREGYDLSPTFADALRMHQLLEAIDRSSQTQGWVEP
ncbi:MAG: Gfo/Idh/MocA family oxidoreductase [Chloroflexi bacterium]|nr:Gfo/Idh/MocA family oxidoreductase [Chloroflexota bacterium]